MTLLLTLQMNHGGTHQSLYMITLKDALNICAMIMFAKQTGQELHWYYAEDKHIEKKELQINN